jgi:gluconokinase
MVVIVMGVAGSGKTTVGRSLASRRGAPYVEGDDLHPAANVAKMSRGEPLTDVDREPWIAALCQRIASAGSGDLVVACSGLRRSHRERLRGAGADVRFLWLDGPAATLRGRLEARERAGGHFMGASMLDSQRAAMEPPGGEPGVVRVGIEPPPDAVVAAAAAAIGWG